MIRELQPLFDHPLKVTYRLSETAGFDSPGEWFITEAFLTISFRGRTFWRLESEVFSIIPGDHDGILVPCRYFDDRHGVKDTLIRMLALYKEQVKARSISLDLSSL
jgi:hypothetical protein